MVEKNLSLREKIKNYREKNKDFLLTQEKISAEKYKTSREVQTIQGALLKVAFVLRDFFGCLLARDSASSNKGLSDPVFQTMLRLKKKDWLVLLAYYLITLPFFTHEFISDEPYAFGENTSMIIVLGMCILMWGIIFSTALAVIFGCCFFLFYLFVCMLHLMCFLSTTEEKKYFKEKFSKEWFYTNLARMNIFVWNLIISILAFSYLAKIFSFFKGGKGTFGGGGASGKY